MNIGVLPGHADADFQQSSGARTLASMPGYLHEGLLELFRTDPTLAATLLADLGVVQVPDYTDAVAEPCDFTDMGPKEFRGDFAISLQVDGQVVLGICVEVQLSRKKDRWWSWPVYVATLRARLRCPVILLVIAPNKSVAEWAARPIELGNPGFVLRPIVIGPEQVPVVTDLVRAKAAPERAVLSAMAHGDGPCREEVLTAFLACLLETDEEHARLYYDLVDEVLSEESSRYLEAMMTMTHEYQGRVAKKYVAEGRAEGLEAGREEGREEGVALSIVRVLIARGLPVTDAVRSRVMECRDLDRLTDWLTRAATATATEDLFT